MKLAVLLTGAALLAAAGQVMGGESEGSALYKIYCTQCHGLDGNGNGINADALTVQPRDHTDPVEMGARTDDDLRKAIKHGGKAVNKSVLMPSWEANLDDEQVTALIAHLRTLCCQSQ